MTPPVAIPRGADYRFVPPPQLVLFDLDNTICDYAGARLARTRYAFEPCFADTAEFERAVAEAVASAVHGSEHFPEVLAAHGITDPAAAQAAHRRYIEDRFRGLELYGDSLAVVAEIARTRKVGMITNGPADIQRAKLELLKLVDVFPAAVVSGEVGVWKPERAIFDLALQRAGVAARDAIYVGDSPEHDVPGAHAAGLGAVWINRAGIAWPGGDLPEVEIRDLLELLPVIGLEPLA
jgi:putative hydrolase of the HAD superfamily